MRLIAAAVAMLCGACSQQEQQSPAPAAPVETPKTPAVPAAVLLPAPDRRVFDLISLGERLTLRACTDLSAKPCVQDWMPGTHVYVPSLGASDRYRMVLVLQVVDGLIESVQINAKEELGADDGMLADLLSKYGDPTDVSDTAAVAIWRFEDLTVTFQARASGRRHAVALIETPRGTRHALERARKAEETRQRI